MSRLPVDIFIAVIVIADMFVLTPLVVLWVMRSIRRDRFAEMDE